MDVCNKLTYQWVSQGWKKTPKELKKFNRTDFSFVWRLGVKTSINKNSATFSFKMIFFILFPNTAKLSKLRHLLFQDIYDIYFAFSKLEIGLLPSLLLLAVFDKFCAFFFCIIFIALIIPTSGIINNAMIMFYTFLW